MNGREDRARDADLKRPPAISRTTLLGAEQVQAFCKYIVDDLYGFMQN